jgi:hypothetical protein
MSKQQKTYLIIAAVALLFLVVFALYFYKKGKKYTPQDVTLPPDLNAPGTTQTWNPGSHTDEIYKDLSEIWGVHESEPYNALNKLSNSQLAAVHNDWNHRYAEEFEGQTLAQAIRSDFTVWNSSWSTIAGAVADRLDKITGS